MKKDKQYSHRLETLMNFDNGFVKDELDNALAKAIAGAMQVMIDKGWIEYMSPIDISRKYGNTRQYWEKLIKDGKIPYHHHGGGKFTLNIHVEGYLKNKYGENYPTLLKQALANIRNLYFTGKTSGSIECPICGYDTLQFYVNREYTANGHCKECKFRINFVIATTS